MLWRRNENRPVNKLSPIYVFHGKTERLESLKVEIKIFISNYFILNKKFCKFTLLLAGNMENIDMLFRFPFSKLLA